MEFICAANWKMNQDVDQTRGFLNEFFEKVTPGDLNSFMFFPPALLASEFSKFNDSDLKWGAQNFHLENTGAFTGENSPQLYKKMGAQVMLIGHSERRSLFGETDLQINKKIQKCVELGLIPMLCVGETLAEREAGKAEEVVNAQLTEALQGFPQPQNLIVAYEPVWAIGTGKVAEVSDVKTMHDFIKVVVGQNTFVLYGGSVKPENAKELSAVENVNGFLIGGASLKCESLLQIFNAVKA